MRWSPAPLSCTSLLREPGQSTRALLGMHADAYAVTSQRWAWLRPGMACWPGYANKPSKRTLCQTRRGKSRTSTSSCSHCGRCSSCKDSTAQHPSDIYTCRRDAACQQNTVCADATISCSTGELTWPAQLTIKSQRGDVQSRPRISVANSIRESTTALLLRQDNSAERPAVQCRHARTCTRLSLHQMLGASSVQRLQR
jgi:hypothetical protein